MKEIDQQMNISSQHIRTVIWGGTFHLFVGQSSNANGWVANPCAHTSLIEVCQVFQIMEYYALIST